MTLESLFERRGGRINVIHCDTREKAHRLLKRFDELGKKWCNGKSYLEQDNYNCYGEDTCYTVEGHYSPHWWYQNNNYPIVEFDEIDDFKGGLFYPLNFVKRGINKL